MKKKTVTLTAGQAFELQANKFSNVLDQLNEQTKVWIEIKDGMIKGLTGILILQMFLAYMVFIKLLWKQPDKKDQIEWYVSGKITEWWWLMIVFM